MGWAPLVSWSDVVALISFGLAGSGSPGPNNTLLLASGVTFGLRRSVPHIVGATLGVGALVLTVAAGVGTLLETLPGARLTLKVSGSAYLVYLAWRSLGSHRADQPALAKPLHTWEALIFQFVNPKAWLLAIGVVSAFLPPRLPAVIGAMTVTSIFAAVSAVCFTVWSAGGAALHGVMSRDRSARMVNAALAVLLAASVVLIWV